MLSAGARAPAFALDNLAGGKTALAEVLSQGPVLLAFYKVNCPTCQLALPFLGRVSKGALRVFAISQDDESATARFREKLGITLPTLLDRAEERYPASNGFGITNVPSLFLLEQDGNIAHAGHGFQKQEIEELGNRSGVKVFKADDNVPQWKAG